MTPAAAPRTFTVKPRITKGWCEVPRSLVENQALLTRAELAFALIALRRQNQPISDATWESWTGLSARHKENAIRGLRAKCLHIDGRGNKATYRFDGALWPKYVTESAKERVRARTAGRGVDPKRGAKVHPDCRAHGCAMLAEPETELTLVPASPDAQPVARSGEAAQPPAAAKPAASGLVVIASENERRALAATKNAKRVARNGASDPAEDIWAKTLAGMRSIFPLVGLAFLVRLLAVVRAVFSDVTDIELAEAVKVAWGQKRKTQKSEGLFLLTVPEALRLVRNRPPEAPEGPPVDIPAGVRLLCLRVKEGLESRGAPFAEIARDVADLARRVTSANLHAIESEMEGLEARIIDIAAGVLTDAERAAVADCVAAGIENYRDRMNAVQFANLRASFTDRETLKVLALPRLSSFYV